MDPSVAVGKMKPEAAHVTWWRHDASLRPCLRLRRRLGPARPPRASGASATAVRRAHSPRAPNASATAGRRARLHHSRPHQNVVPQSIQTTAAPSVSAVTALAALITGPSGPVGGAARRKSVVLVALELDVARSSVSGAPDDGCDGTKRARRSGLSQQHRAEVCLGCDLCRCGRMTQHRRLGEMPTVVTVQVLLEDVMGLATTSSLEEEKMPAE
ncbi:hypothetical protein GUJ93_ZPchr0003g18525 [Zizania palustris]|uniref:Uncharacterized protein n=1 Tax=Zizania palustris TaxID=103762 RepID=A0A8J5VJM5_ZIZPA|nr:hypothetical protein GUJ93_ZPchr0003g18525 [Zizania palustris]